jgi:hypothetical protein
VITSAQFTPVRWVAIYRAFSQPYTSSYDTDITIAAMVDAIHKDAGAR